MTRLFSRTDQSVLGRWWWTVDHALLASILFLVVCGIVMVATASPPVASRIALSEYHFIKRHLIMLIPAMVAMVGMSVLSPRAIWRVCSVGLILGIGALIAVLLVGTEIKGARRWLDLGMSLQPSEFVKPMLAVVMAWLIAREKDQPDFPGYKIALGVFAVVALLLIMQPDFGMTIVVSLIVAAQLFIAGLPWILVVAIAVFGCAGVGLAYIVLPHVRSRIDRFLNPDQGDTYQVDSALDAFRSGGFFGVGPGQGEVKLRVPDAHADFIFAVAGEEFGILTCIIIFVFGFIVLRGLNRVMDSGSLFAVLATGGVLTMFGLQALIHMGASTHLLPAKGMTLPFISYGGSSLIAVGFSMGILLGLTRQTYSGVARGNRLYRTTSAGQERKAQT